MASLYVPSYVIPSDLKKILPELRAQWRKLEKEKRSLACPNSSRCKHYCKTSQGMLRHFVKCGKDKFPFKCHYCSAQYGTHQTLKNHISSNHSDKLKRSGSKSKVVWTPTDSDERSSDEIDVVTDSDKQWTLTRVVAESNQRSLDSGDDDASSSVSGILGESDVCDPNESGHVLETSEGGEEESVWSGEGEVWRKGAVQAPIDLASDSTDSQNSDSTIDIISVSVDDEKEEVQKREEAEGEGEGEGEGDMTDVIVIMDEEAGEGDVEEEDELFADDSLSVGERWKKYSSSDSGESTGYEQNLSVTAGRPHGASHLVGGEDDNIESPQWEPLSDMEEQTGAQTRNQLTNEMPLLPVARRPGRKRKKGVPRFSERRTGQRLVKIDDEDSWDGDKEHVVLSMEKKKGKGREDVGKGKKEKEEKERKGKGREDVDKGKKEKEEKERKGKGREDVDVDKEKKEKEEKERKGKGREDVDKEKREKQKEVVEKAKKEEQVEEVKEEVEKNAGDLDKAKKQKEEEEKEEKEPEKKEEQQVEKQKEGEGKENQKRVKEEERGADDSTLNKNYVIQCEVLSGEEKHGDLVVLVPISSIEQKKLSLEVEGHRPRWKVAERRGEGVRCPNFEKCLHSCQTARGMDYHFRKCRQLQMSWGCMCGRVYTVRSALIDHLRSAHDAKVVTERAPPAPSSVIAIASRTASDKVAANKQEAVSRRSVPSSPAFKVQTPSSVSPLTVTSSATFQPPVQTQKSSSVTQTLFKTQMSSHVSPSPYKIQTSSSVTPSLFKAQMSSSMSPMSPSSLSAQVSSALSPLSFSQQNKKRKMQSGRLPEQPRDVNAKLLKTSSMAVARPHKGRSESKETALRCSDNTLDYIPAVENAVCNDHDYTVIEGQQLSSECTKKKMGISPWTHRAVATTASTMDALSASWTFPISGTSPTATIVILDEATKELIGLSPADVLRDQSLHSVRGVPSGRTPEMEVVLINDIHFQYNVNNDIHCHYDVEVISPEDYPYFVEAEKERGDISIMDDEHEVDSSLLEMTDIQADTFCHEHGQVDSLDLLANLRYLRPSCAEQVDGAGTSCPEGSNEALEAKFELYRRCGSVDGVASSNGSSGFQPVFPKSRFSELRAEVSRIGLAHFGRVASNSVQALTEGYAGVSEEEVVLSQFDGSGSRRKKKASSKTATPAKKLKETEDGEELMEASSVADPAMMKVGNTPMATELEKTADIEEERPCSSRVDESSSSVVPKSPEERMIEQFRSCLDQGIRLSSSKRDPRTAPHSGSTQRKSTTVRLSSRKTDPRTALPFSDPNPKKVVTTVKDCTSSPLLVEGNMLEEDATLKAKPTLKGKGKRHSSASKSSPSPKRKKASEMSTAVPHSPEIPPEADEAGKDRRTLKKTGPGQRRKSKDVHTPDTVGNEEVAEGIGIASFSQHIEQHPKDTGEGIGKEAIAQPQENVAQHTTDEVGMDEDEEDTVQRSGMEEMSSEQNAASGKPARTKAGKKGKGRARKGKMSSSTVTEIPTTIPPDTPTLELRKIFHAMLRKYYVIRCTVAGCTYKAVNISAMLYHFARCGQEAKQYKCHKCDKTYTSTQGLKYHVDSVHRVPVPEEPTKEEGTRSGHFDIVPTEQLDRRKAAKMATAAVQQMIQELAPSVASATMATAPTGTPPSEVAGQATTSDPQPNGLESLQSAIEGELLTESPLPAAADASPLIPQLTKAKVVELRERLRKEKKVKCPNEFCTQTLGSMTALKYHVPRCTPTRAQSQCPICSKRLRSQERLKLHLRAKHPQAALSLDFDTEYNPEEDSDDEEAESEGIFPRTPKGGYSALYAHCYKEGMASSWNETCFPDWLPASDDWRTLSDGRRSQYLLAEEENPLKGVSCQVDEENVVELEGVSHYKGVAFTKQELGASGAVANTGGSILSIDWLPLPHGQEEHTHFLAVSTNRLQEMDHPHILEDQFSCEGVVQVWAFVKSGQVPEEGATVGGIISQLRLCVAHEFGYVRSLKWCPSGTFVAPGDGDKTLGRLGLLALACSDGSVRILSIPHTQPLIDAIGEKGKTPLPLWVESVQTQAVLQPSAVSQSGEAGCCGPCICVDWSPGAAHDKMAASFASGMIAVWHLLTASPLLKSPTPGGTKLCLYPVVQIPAHPCPCTVVQWCPNDPQWLVSGGHDCKLLVWNTYASTFTPSLVLEKPGLGIVRDIVWPPFWGGCLLIDDSVKSVFGCAFTLLSHTDAFTMPNCLKSPAPFTSASHSPWNNRLAAVTFGGAIELNCLPTHVSKHTPKQVSANQKTLLQLEARYINSADTNGESDETSGSHGYTLNIRGPKCADSVQAYCPYENPVTAIMKVQWNPNQQAHKWLAAATRSGLLIVLTT